MMQKDSELFEQFSGDKFDEVGAPYWVSRPELPLGPIIAGIIGILLVLIVLVDIIFYKTKNRGVFIKIFLNKIKIISTGLTYLLCRRARKHRSRKFDSRKERLVDHVVYWLCLRLLMILSSFSSKIRGQQLTSSNGQSRNTR